MKKFLTTFLIMAICGVFAMFDCAEAKKAKKPKTYTKIEFETPDGFLIVGNLYFAKQKTPPKPLVVVLHSFGSKKEDWGNLPLLLREKNYNVLVLDQRGHGKSVYYSTLKYKSHTYFTLKDWAKYPDDALEAVKYVKNHYPKVDTTKIIFIGSDIGANTAVLAGGKMKIKPLKFVLISPMMKFKGLYIPIVISNFPHTPMMLMVSAKDRFSMDQSNQLSKFIQSKITRKNYPQGGTGMLLLKRNPSSYNDIVNFVTAP